jgi:hypothetical protein
LSAAAPLMRGITVKIGITAHTGDARISVRTMYTFVNAVSTCLAVSTCCQRSTREWYTTDRTTSGTMSTVTANSTIYAVSTGPTVRGSTVGALTQRFFPSNRPIDSSKRLVRTTSNVAPYTAGPTSAVNRRVNIL